MRCYWETNITAFQCRSRSLAPLLLTTFHASARIRQARQSQKFEIRAISESRPGADTEQSSEGLQNSTQTFVRSAFKLVAVMDHATCHIVYVDKRASGDRYEKRPGPNVTGPLNLSSGFSSMFDWENKEVQMNLRSILSVFQGGTYLTISSRI